MALPPWEIALFPLRQVVHMLLALALSAREIMLFSLRQVVPRQSTLMPRQPVPLPKQSTLTPRVLGLLPQAAQPSSQVNDTNRSPNDNSFEDPNPKWVINLSSKPLT